MIGYVPGAGWLHRAHPFAVFGLAGATAAAAVLVPGPRGPIAVAGLALALLATAGLIAAVRTAAALSLPFWIFLLLIHGLIGDDPGRAVLLASRLTAIIAGFTGAMAAVHPGRMTEALVRAGAPFSVAYLFSATLQAIPRLRDRATAILEAQQCRGLDPRGSPVQRVRNLVPLAVPLVLGALAEIDERTAALETRGAGGRRRTPLDPPPWRPADTFLVGMAAIAVLGAGIWRWVG